MLGWALCTVRMFFGMRIAWPLFRCLLLYFVWLLLFTGCQSNHCALSFRSFVHMLALLEHWGWVVGGAASRPLPWWGGARWCLHAIRCPSNWVVLHPLAWLHGARWCPHTEHRPFQLTPAFIRLVSAAHALSLLWWRVHVSDAPRSAWSELLLYVQQYSSRYVCSTKLLICYSLFLLLADPMSIEDESLWHDLHLKCLVTMRYISPYISS